MKKFNWKGLGAILMVALGSITLVHDFIKLLQGYSFTIFGLISLVIIIAIASEGYKYIEDRLK
jgi:hypothetical protein